MTNSKLHPSIEKFKLFVKSNPKILEEARSGRTTLQELYEDWYLLGEDDTRWDDFRSEKKDEVHTSESKTDWFSNILGTMKKMDPEQMQSYIGHLSQALGAVQGVLTQFQNGAAKNSSNSPHPKPNHPFSFRKD
ncbi:YlbD family protein [Bacillus sp. V3B]|uniref:YlbD family protein n=1 Tax=Bacillus sp. V3B TaxID=2804915 RepID=UPI00210BA3F9|nr:YlbD family protein [Bacillus sp. V3B]MCQ6275143.1 YlbD family protein [Bacillus sp. V3B]